MKVVSGLKVLFVASIGASLIATGGVGVSSAHDRETQAKEADCAPSLVLEDNHDADHAHDSADHAHDSKDCDKPKYYIDPAVKDPAILKLLRYSQWRSLSTRNISPPDITQTFARSSRPQAPYTIFLDFDGASLAGTGWTEIPDTPPDLAMSPFTLDPDTSNFSNEEHQFIHTVWEGVSEDFAPFNVNVTTQEPPAERLLKTSPADSQYGIRVVVSSSAGTGAPCSCAGKAFVDIFDKQEYNKYRDALVFQPLGGITIDPYRVSQLASHEAGHTFGLDHHGSEGAEYTSGDFTWTPIMGSGTIARFTQWSDGKYPGASKPGQQDMTIIGSLAQFVNDEPQNLAPLVNNTEVSGMISSGTDVDTYNVAPVAGEANTLRVTLSHVSNLNLRISQIDSSGATIAAEEFSSKGTIASSTKEIALLPRTGRVTLESAPVNVRGHTVSSQNAIPSNYGSVGRYKITFLAKGSNNPPMPNPNPTPNPRPGPFRVTLLVNTLQVSDPTVIRFTPSYQYANGTGSYSYRLTSTRTGFVVHPNTGEIAGSMKPGRKRIGIVVTDLSLKKRSTVYMTFIAPRR